MKNLMIPYNIFLILIFVLFNNSCKQTDEFIEPLAKIDIANKDISILDKLEVKNLGKGDKFSFWPGDAGHNYSLRTAGGNYGLSPNAGTGFVYYYSKAGVYTVVMIASSYDAMRDKFVQKIDSAVVTVTGSAVNNFTSFSIQNALLYGYYPAGEIKNDSIFIRIAPVNRPYYPDSLLAYKVNLQPPVFSVAEDLSFVTIHDDEGNIYKGLGVDAGKLKLFNIIDGNNVEPNVRDFTIVDNATQNAHTYKVAAMLYPQLFSFIIDKDTALLFSKDGISQLKQKDIYSYYRLNPDSIYVGVNLINYSGDITKVKPAFTVSPNCVVTLNGVVQTSGVSTVNFSVQPIVYNITRNFGSFKITTKVAVNYTAPF